MTKPKGIPSNSSRFEDFPPLPTQAQQKSKKTTALPLSTKLKQQGSWALSRKEAVSKRLKETIQELKTYQALIKTVQKHEEKLKKSSQECSLDQLSSQLQVQKEWPERGVDAGKLLDSVSKTLQNILHDLYQKSFTFPKNQGVVTSQPLFQRSESLLPSKMASFSFDLKNILENLTNLKKEARESYKRGEHTTFYQQEGQATPLRVVFEEHAQAFYLVCREYDAMSLVFSMATGKSAHEAEKRRITSSPSTTGLERKYSTRVESLEKSIAASRFSPLSKETKHQLEQQNITSAQKLEKAEAELQQIHHDRVSQLEGLKSSMEVIYREDGKTSDESKNLIGQVLRQLDRIKTWDDNQGVPTYECFSAKGFAIDKLLEIFDAQALEELEHFDRKQAEAQSTQKGKSFHSHSLKEPSHFPLLNPEKEEKILVNYDQSETEERLILSSEDCKSRCKSISEKCQSALQELTDLKSKKVPTSLNQLLQKVEQRISEISLMIQGKEVDEGRAVGNKNLKCNLQELIEKTSLLSIKIKDCNSNAQEKDPTLLKESLERLRGEEQALFNGSLNAETEAENRGVNQLISCGERSLQELKKSLEAKNFSTWQPQKTLEVYQTLKVLGFHKEAHKLLSYHSREWGYAQSKALTSKMLQQDMQKELALIWRSSSQNWLEKEITDFNIWLEQLSTSSNRTFFKKMREEIEAIRQESQSQVRDPHTQMQAKRKSRQVELSTKIQRLKEEKSVVQKEMQILENSVNPNQAGVLSYFGL